MAAGDAAYLVAARSRTAASSFGNLGIEPIYEFEVRDFRVTVAVDGGGQNVHTLAPLVWRDKIARERLLALV